MHISKNHHQKCSGLILIVVLVSCFLMVPLLTVAIGSSEASQEVWWNFDWPYRIPIAINNTKVEGNQEGFPVLIDLMNSSLGEAQIDGDDVVFTDYDSNKLSHEIEFFDRGAGRLVAWVKVPQLSSTEDTILYLYYGNSDASNQQDPSAVWDSDYKVVLHLNEEYGFHNDSTSNGNNGTPYNGVVQEIIGKIDGADSFDGVNDYVRVAGSPSLSGITENITVECWVNLAEIKDTAMTLVRTPYDLAPKAWDLSRLGIGDLRFHIYDGGVVQIASTPWTPVAGTWYYIVGRYDGNRLSIFVDGVEYSGKDYVGKIDASDDGLVVGAAKSTGGWGFISAIIDELRVSSSARPSGWILTSYNNQKDPDSFYTIGDVETHAGAKPSILDELPQNEATEVYTNPILSVSATDANGDLMKILFSVNVSGTWQVIEVYEDVSDGMYTCITTNMSKLGTTYYWNVSVTDGNNWNNKTFSFTTTTTVLEPKWVSSGFSGGASGVLIADVDGDGLEEVVHAGLSGVEVLNGHDGSLVWSALVDGLGGWCQPQMADLNNDGFLEIIIPLVEAGIHVLHARNGSTYWRETNLGGTILGSPVVADIDGDGYPTIFVASTEIKHKLDGYGRITALSYEGQVLHQVFSWRPCAGGLSLADTDGDGEFELYMGDRYMYYTEDQNYGKGVRSFWARNLTLRWEHPDILCSSHIPMLADVNADGILDVIACDQRGGIVVLNSTDGSAIKKGWPSTPGHYQPSIHDIDGDGRLEIIMACGDYNFTEYGIPMDQVVVWDLVEWEEDANMTVGRCRYAPQIADVTGDGVMEIIACNSSTIFIFNQSYSLIAQVTGLWGKLNYAVVQDIDGDGYSEVVVSSNSGKIYAYDTPARRPEPRARSEVQFYSERRLGVAEYVPPPGGSAPIISTPSPDDKAKGVPISLSHLSFDLKDFEYDLMDYWVVTSPDIGSDSGTNVSNGRYNVSISGLLRSTTYTWTVKATDGTHWTNKTYKFTTYPGEPPSHETPILMLSGGTNTTDENLICYNQTTSDPEGDRVTNIYNWNKNGTSITNLLLSFDTNSTTTVKDYSGYDNNGIVEKGVTWISKGIVGGAYEFDRGYIMIPGTDTLDGDGNWSEITVEQWIYITEDQWRTRTLAKIPSYEIGFSEKGTNRIFAGIWIDTGEWNVSGYYRVTVSPGRELELERWYHVAFSYKNGTLTLYINGEVEATKFVTGKMQTSGTQPLYMGWFDYFSGRIDEVRIYPKSLSPQQISQRYLETKDGVTNSSTIVSQETNVGDVWECEVTPNDGYQDGLTKFSNTIMWGYNNRPYVRDLTITPATPQTTDDLMANYTYLDPDGDPENGTEIRWYRNVDLQPEFNDLLEIPSSATAIGETWYFTVKPKDGTDFGELQVSPAVIIG